jgi:hypothetical protein
MTAIRRTALTLALALTAILGTAGSTAPAQASFADSASRSTTVATAVVTAPANVVGSLTCGRTSATMAATWGLSSTPGVSGYDVRVYFSDGFVQVVELGPTATSWSAPIAPYYVTAFSIQYTVTTKTSYGWFKESTKTGSFQCWSPSSSTTSPKAAGGSPTC